MKSYYQELTSRNFGLLTAEEQEEIKKVKILVAGCGVGSVVAVAATRFGFANFVVADGDVVEISNLNRQEYSSDDIGANKAQALKKRILAIDPQAKVRAVPKFVKAQNVASLIKDVNIVIDTIDPEDGQAILHLHKEARKRNIPIISPYDTGFGSHVFVYNAKGKTYKELLGYKKQRTISSIKQDDFYNAFVAHTTKFVPDYLFPVVDKLLRGEIKHFPQPIIAAQALSSLVVDLMKKIVLKEKLLGDPYEISFDPELVDIKKKNDKKTLVNSRRRRVS